MRSSSLVVLITAAAAVAGAHAASAQAPGRQRGEVGRAALSDEPGSEPPIDQALATTRNDEALATSQGDAAIARRLAEVEAWPDARRVAGGVLEQARRALDASRALERDGNGRQRPAERARLVAWAATQLASSLIERARAAELYEESVRRRERAALRAERARTALLAAMREATRVSEPTSLPGPDAGVPAASSVEEGSSTRRPGEARESAAAGPPDGDDPTAAGEAAPGAEGAGTTTRRTR